MQQNHGREPNCRQTTSKSLLDLFNTPDHKGDDLLQYVLLLQCYIDKTITAACNRNLRRPATQRK